MKKYSRDTVIKATSIVFPNERNDFIMDLIDHYGRGPYENEKDRVHLAMLKLSAGSIQRLIQCVRLAKTDYKDIVMLAEYHPDTTQINKPYKLFGIKK